MHADARGAHDRALSIPLWLADRSDSVQPHLGMPTDEWLLPEALKEAGYETALIGKWHLGHGDRKYWPRQRGFDHQYGPLLGEIDYFTHEQHGVIDWFRDNEPLREPGYSTALLGDAAVKLVEDHDVKTPLFLDLSFNAPHAPYQRLRNTSIRYRTIIEDLTRARLRGADHRHGR